MIVDPAHALLCRDDSRLPLLQKPVVATLGVFDGLHRGHQALFTRVAQRTTEISGGKGGSSVVLSFYPHPDVVLGKANDVRLLTSLRQRLILLRQCGIDLLFLQHFTARFSHLRAKEFIESLLFSTLQVDHLVLGADAHVGYKREGTPEFILDLFSRSGRSAEIVPFVLAKNHAISSQTIRAALAEGELARAAQLLGRPYAIEGRIVHGDGRGKTLGFPTANLHAPLQAPPRKGVYASVLTLDGKHYDAVTNVGTRPTFAHASFSIESYLLDYDGADFYGARAELTFVARIRDEKKFDGIEALRSQIAADISTAKSILSKGG